MSILVAGGAGYIGSHTCVELIQAGYDIVVADNLSNSCEEAVARVERITGKKIPFVRTELCHDNEVEALFTRYPDIDSVIHFAGLKAVGESVTKPLEYYSNNLISTLYLLQAMRRHGVKNFVFSSSATVYGDPATVPIRENLPTGGTTNPYGTSKLFQEKILTDVCAADPELNVALLRYFNPIGAHESGLIGEDPNGIPNNLVPYIAQVAVGKLEKLHVYGNDYPTPDGTGVRDYIHVVDLARGHVAALKKLEANCGLFVCNLGTGNGCSVLDVLHAYEKACGRELPYVVEARRPGDIAACYADPSRARDELGWTAQLGIEEMCASSWKWQSMNPNGYKDREGQAVSRPVLVIMAAGMGSRYGGMKQLDPVGNHGQLIIDYSIYDAHRAGFDTVIFVIKEENEADFRACIGDRVSRVMNVKYAFQRKDDLPEGYQVPPERVKPWGTAQAALAARHLIDGPFAIINADDYYGPGAFQLIYDYLRTHPDGELYEYAMVGYLLKNTVTENGSVARGICAVDSGGILREVVERTAIEKDGDNARFTEDGGKTWTPLPGDTTVSMNIWGFTRSFLDEALARFPAFLDRALAENPIKAEYYLPGVVEQLILEGKARVRVLLTGDKWHGVTYRADKPAVVAALAEKTAAGLYPDELWKIQGTSD